MSAGNSAASPASPGDVVYLYTRRPPAAGASICTPHGQEDRSLAGAHSQAAAALASNIEKCAVQAEVVAHSIALLLDRLLAARAAAASALCLQHDANTAHFWMLCVLLLSFAVWRRRSHA